jgi:hypothetical protein
LGCAKIINVRFRTYLLYTKDTIPRFKIESPLANVGVGVVDYDPSSGGRGGVVCERVGFETYIIRLVMDDSGCSIVSSIIPSCQIGCLKLFGIV